MLHHATILPYFQTYPYYMYIICSIIVAHPLVASTTYPKYKTLQNTVLLCLVALSEDPITPPVLGGCQP